jgi:hypothetical protein
LVLSQATMQIAVISPAALQKPNLPESEAPMSRPWLSFSLGCGFVGASLMLGCSHARHCESCSQGSHAMSEQKVIPTAAKPDLQPAPVSSSYNPITQPVAPQVTETPVPEVEQTGFQIDLHGLKNDGIKRRTFRDITADPCFAHADDYSSVTGELYYEKAQEVWTVRYGSAEDEDRYGGSVTLSEVGAMDAYKSGQMVQVMGHMVDPESKERHPSYKVESIQPVKK